MAEGHRGAGDEGKHVRMNSSTDINRAVVLPADDDATVPYLATQVLEAVGFDEPAAR